MAATAEQQESSAQPNADNNGADEIVSFSYVYIPAHIHEPVEERRLSTPKSREVESLLDELKLHFRTTGPAKTDEQKRAHKQALLQNYTGDASKISDALWDTLTNINMVENIAMLSNAPDTGFVGVNMYCDDEASIKHLPSNQRATDIAMLCGKQLVVRGDAFIARIFDNEDDFKRLDFTLQELSSSAPWIAAAKDQAVKRQARGDVAGQFMEQQQQARQARQSSVTVKELTPAEQAKEEGNAAFKSGDWAAAVAHYSTAVTLDGSLVAALNNRAMAHLKLQQWSEAAADCDAVLQKEAGNVKALLRRSAAREGLGNVAGALQDAQRVLELQPKNKEAAEAVEQLKVLTGAPEGASAMDVAAE